MRHSIGIQFARGLKPAIARPWLRRVAVAAIKAEGVDHPVELGIVLAEDEEVQRLNREYRGQDRSTDVLSFSLEEDVELPSQPGEPRMLGEVVISYPQAMRQSAEYGHPLEREVAFLLVHGILHLLGYDHEKPQDEAAMFGRQETILAGLGITRESHQ